MKSYMKEFYEQVLRKPVYTVGLLVYGLIAYLSSICQNITQFEEFQTEYYLGKGKAVLSGRWGQYVWIHLSSVLGPNSILTKLVAFLLFLLAVVLIAAIVYYLSRRATSVQLLILSAGILTYPLIHEVWDYRVNLMVAGNLAATAFSILLLLVGGKSRKNIILAGIFMAIPAASYESCLFCYLLLVTMILFYMNLSDRVTVRNYIKECFLYMIPLIIAVIIRAIVTVFNMKVFHLSFVAGGAITPEWVHGRFPIIEAIRDTFHDYFLKGLVYFPITIFVICFTVFLILCIGMSISRKRISIVVAGLLVLFAVFLQGIVQLLSMPYRTAQPMSIFAGFVMFLIAELIQNARWKWIRYAVVGITMFLIYRQSVYLNEIFILDSQVAENDAAIARNIGYRLLTEFDDKNVYICANNEDRELYAQWNGIMGEEIRKEISYDSDSIGGKLYEKGYRSLYGGEDPSRVLIQSDLFSTMQLLANGPWAMKLYFSYLGYDLPFVWGDEYQEIADKIVKEQHLRRFDVYDAGDFILVNLE